MYWDSVYYYFLIKTKANQTAFAASVMDLVPTHVVPNTNRSLEDDGTVRIVFVCSPGEDGGVLGIFLSL